MTTSYDIDPNTQTVAAAWASSPLGQPEFEESFDFADPAETVVHQSVRTADEPRSLVRHRIVVLAMAGGIAVGAALGLMSVDLTPDQPTAVVPAVTSPRPAVIVAPSITNPPSAEVGQPAPAPARAPTSETGTAGHPPAANVPGPVSANPSPTPEAPAGEETADPPPPADPEPQPPLFDPDLDFKLPLPQPVPDPAPPVLHPDLPKAPVPAPKPKPSTMPDFEIAVGPGS